MSNRNRVFLGKIPLDVRTREIERWLDSYGFRHVERVHIKAGYAFVDFRDYRDAEDCVKDMDRREFMGNRVTVELARGNRDRERDRERSRGRDRRSRDRYGDRDRFERRDRDDRDGREDRRGRKTFNYRNGYFREKYGAPYNTEWRIEVENISSRCGWQEMKDFFRQVGNVTYAECHRKRSGDGAIEYSSKEEMLKAMEKLDGEEFMGKRLKLTQITGNSRSETKRNRRDSRERSREESKEKSREESKEKESDREKVKSKSISKSRSKSKSVSKSREQSPKRSRSTSFA